jgi:drug/metabolite transporter (DMT)-like permease
MATTVPPRPASAGHIWAAMFVLYIVWGSTYLAIRFAVETIPPFLMAAVRFLLAGLILLIWRRLAGDPLPSPGQWRAAAVAGLFLLLGGNGGVVWAEQRVPSGITALLIGCTPLWMVLLDALIRRRKPGWAVMLGLVIGLAGIGLLVGPSELTGLQGEIDPLGALVIILAALSWSAGSLYSQTRQRQGTLPAAPLMNTAAQMLSGGGALLALGTLSGEWTRFDLSGFSSRSVLAVAYLVVIGALVGFSAYVWLLKNAPITLVSTYAYVNPLVAVFLGSLLAAEPLTSRVAMAAVLIIGAVALITLKRKPEK